MSSVFNFHDSYGDGDMPPDHHYSYDESAGENADFFDNHPFLEAVFCYGWLFLLFYCLLCRNNREPPSTEVGDRIRARARENAERIQQKKIKEELSPAERKKIVNQHMVTKVVLSKDEQGNLTLGVVDSGETSDDVESQLSDEADENEAEADTTTTNKNENITHLQADEDEEEGFTCVICLDCFEVDDKISWTKHDPTCRHVFHDECIRQWLEDRRQDECPSCRCHLVPPPEVPKAKSIEEDDDSDEEQGDVTTEQPSQTEESDDSDNDDEPKEDGESGLFSMVSGLFRSTAGRPPSAPRSGEYNLVSVNSSFDSQEAPEQVQDTQVALGASSSSSSDESEEGSTSPRPLLASSTQSVETMSISEALRQSEVMEEDEEDEEMGGAATSMELGMEDAVVSDIVFSP